MATANRTQAGNNKKPAASATSSGRTSGKEVQTANKPQSKPGTAVATKVNRAPVVIDQTQELMAELAADSGKGFEEADRDAFAIPFLTILQDLSPQTKKKMAGYIEGAKAGDIYQSVSQELAESVRVIPCHYSRVFIEWVPRAKGGGFVAAYDPLVGLQKAETATREGGSLLLPNGNELYDTRQHFVLVITDEGVASPALIAMKSTGLKVSRRWMAQMNSAVIEVNSRIIAPPMFAWSYKLGVEEEANEKGSWFVWQISDRERVGDVNLYRQAKAFGQSMRGGNVKVNYDEMQNQDLTKDYSDRGAAPDAPQDFDDSDNDMTTDTDT